MTKDTLNAIVGPRAPRGVSARRRVRYLIPTLLFALAAATLTISFFQPYWKMTLQAPQYPGGLHVQAHLNRLTGDVAEIDGLNHYIGMRPLEEAAQLERTLSPMLIGSMALLILGAVFIHTKWAALLALPALLFPAGFLIDLHLWLRHFGNNLDPSAALSSSVKPFTPPVLGEGVVGNFRTVASPDTGLWMAAAASLVILAGLYFHRRAYKPLVDKSRHDSQSMGVSARTVGTPRRALTAALVVVVSLAHGARTGRAEGFDLPRALRDAPTGAVVRVPAGVYSAPVVIDRPLMLIADGVVVIDGDGRGPCVLVEAPDVVVRGFHVRNTGDSLHLEHAGINVVAARATIEDNVLDDVLFGINLSNAPNSVVRNNVVHGKELHVARRGDGIRLWSSHDSVIEGNRVRRVRDVVVWYSERVRLIDNVVADSRYGMHFMYCHENVLEGNILEDNSVGAFLMYSRDVSLRGNVMRRNRGPSGYGLGIKDMQGVTIKNNAIVANRVGVYFDNPPIHDGEHDEIAHNLVAYNDVGMALQPSVSQAAIYLNSFIENEQQIAVRGGGVLRGNELSRDGRGNFWSDYRGYDLDGDGVGDIPHRVESLWDSLVDRQPNMRLFLHSPAQRAIEFAASAFPVVKPRPVISDDAPLLRPAHDAPAAAAAGRPTPYALASGGLLTLLGCALLCAAPIRARRDNKESST